MPQLHAQPYDITANGFYFESLEEYAAKANSNRNDHGDPVEEYEIQFIDGDHIDCDLAKAWGINQANIGQYFNACESWDDQEKTVFIIAVGEAGYSFDPDSVSPTDSDVDIYHLDSMKELAEQFVDEGLYGDIPESLQYYIDFDAIGRDLSVEYSETTIAGGRYVYACR